MPRYVDPRQVLSPTTLARIMPERADILAEVPPPLASDGFDAWVEGLHPAVALLFLEAVGELTITGSPGTHPAEARHSARAALYAGYSHGRARLRAENTAADLLRLAAEELALTMHGVVMRLDPLILRTLLDSSPAMPPPLVDHAPEARERSGGMVQRAYDYGLAVAVVECDFLDTE